jgi:hypothetical protein
LEHSWRHVFRLARWLFYRPKSFQKCKAENMVPVLKIKSRESFVFLGWSSSWGLQNASGVQYKRYPRSLHNCTQKL